MTERMPWDEYRDTGEPDEREQLACKDDGVEACSCHESLVLRSRLDLTTRAYAEACKDRRALRARLGRLKERAPVITDDPYFYEVANAIDKHLGWPSPEAEEAGKYAERVVEVAAELDVMRADLIAVTAERDYLRGMASPDDLRVMRQDLAKQFEHDHCGALPESEQTDFDKVL